MCIPGSSEGLTLLEAEHTLALLNEYLVQVAAPEAMPAGFQVWCVPLSSTGMLMAGDALPPPPAQVQVACYVTLAQPHPLFVSMQAAASRAVHLQAVFELLFIAVQVQIYDFAGFKLSYVMGDFFKLYKVRPARQTLSLWVVRALRSSFKRQPSLWYGFQQAALHTCGSRAVV
jgi:hypothetical protein